MGGSLATSYAL